LKELFPAFRTRYFFGFGCGGKAAAAETKKNELKQMLQSGLGL